MGLSSDIYERNQFLHEAFFKVQKIIKLCRFFFFAFLDFLRFVFHFNIFLSENQAINVALTEKDMEDHLMDLEHADGEELVNVDGTKVTLSSKVSLKNAVFE